MGRCNVTNYDGRNCLEDLMDNCDATMFGNIIMKTCEQKRGVTIVKTIVCEVVWGSWGTMTHHDMTNKIWLDLHSCATQ